MNIEIKHRIDQFFEQERKSWQVEDFIIDLRYQICSIVPENINLLFGSVDHLKYVVNRLDLYLELTEYLNERIFAFYEKNQGTD